MLKKFSEKEPFNETFKMPLAIGVHAVEEALEAQKPIEKILISKDKTQPGITSIIKQARQLGVPVQFVPSEKLQRYSRGNHQGIIAIISPVHFHSLQQVIDFTYQQGEAPLLLMLEGITDVRNFGAIARTAWASGVHALIIPSAENALINEISIKTSGRCTHAYSGLPREKFGELPDAAQGAGHSDHCCRCKRRSNAERSEFKNSNANHHGL